MLTKLCRKSFFCFRIHAGPGPPPCRLQTSRAFHPRHIRFLFIVAHLVTWATELLPRRNAVFCHYNKQKSQLANTSHAVVEGWTTVITFAKYVLWCFITIILHLTRWLFISINWFAIKRFLITKLCKSLEACIFTGMFTSACTTEQTAGSKRYMTNLLY